MASVIRKRPLAATARGRKPPAAVIELPDFIEPMLATIASKPFDGGQEWLFEIKWDGFRALCLRDRSGCRLIGREGTDFTLRFPELVKALSILPVGTIIDGEIVAMRADGTQDFNSLLRGNGKGRSLAYIAFDLLYADGKSLMSQKCVQRRASLRPIIRAVADARVTMSEGVVGNGVAYFNQAVAARLEGVIAKRLDAPYRPGIRSDEWIKLKARKEIVAAIIGYVPDDENGLKSLIIAAPSDGELRCVGRVGSGMAPNLAAELLRTLRGIECRAPVVSCSGVKGYWVEPSLFCRVSYQEVLASGRLRQPVLEAVLER